MEYEEGIMEDIKEVLEKIAPENADYKHHLRWTIRMERLILKQL